LKDCRAYPEGTVKMQNYQTPCHAATISGNDKKLNILLKDIQDRKTKVESSFPSDLSSNKVAPSIQDS
jgi:hypothetical protein